MKVENESPDPEPELPSFHRRSISHKNVIRRATKDVERNNDNNHSNNNGGGDGGPIAEALIQNEQMFHSLKILKPSPSEIEKESHKSMQTQTAEKDTNTASQRKGRIYSQVCIIAKMKRNRIEKRERASE